jgi:hypothetical protein
LYCLRRRSDHEVLVTGCVLRDNISDLGPQGDAELLGSFCAAEGLILTVNIFDGDGSPKEYESSTHFLEDGTLNQKSRAALSQLIS